MARSLKTVGMRELESLRRRAKRQLAMERAHKQPVEEIVEHLNAVEKIIVEMWEEGEDGD
jgi:hypothetical protein